MNTHEANQSRPLHVAAVTLIVFSIATIIFHSVVSAADASTRTQHALIVGVSEYPTLTRRDLRGPVNDAVLVRDTLRDQGFDDANITLIADGVEGADLPNRAAIVGALEELAGTSAKPGDFVYLHFSGHGAQQPSFAASDSDNAEPDGFDEIFLPRDIGRWAEGDSVVENAIVDDDIAHYITRMRNNGVFVWIVFDSCHSGSMTRALPVDDEMDRSISFEDLVDPEHRDAARDAMTRSEQSGTRTRGGTSSETSLEDVEANDDAAGYVAFFAAQTTELAPEFRQPAGHPERQSHGLLTFTLMKLIQTQPGLTYRQLGQQLLRSYEAQRRTRQTPSFIGSSLDAPIFGSSEIERVEQYRVSIDESGTITIAGGNLHDISEQTILALVPQPASPAEDIIGYVEVTSAQLALSTVEPIAFNEVPALPSADVPDSAYARPVAKSLALQLRVALPEESNASAAVIEWAETSTSTLYSFVNPGEPADLRLAVEEDRVWLVPPSGILCSFRTLANNPGADCQSQADLNTAVKLDDEAWQAELDDKIGRIAKASNLLRLANFSGDSGAPGVSLTMEVRREAGSPFEAVPVGTRPQLVSGDRIRFRIENDSDRAQDVTLLFIDGQWGITALFPGRRNDQARIEADGFKLVGGTNGFGVNANTTGLERVLMIAVPGERGGTIEDFSFLEQERLPPATRNLRSGSTPGIRGQLEDAGFRGGRTRGLTDEAEDESTMAVLSWQTVAR